MADSSVQAVHIDVTRLENKIDKLTTTTEKLNSMVRETNIAVETANHNIQVLTQKFLEMVDDQKRQAALQQAATELVRVRQELEQNYGNYKVIRETMLGVLQATDLGDTVVEYQKIDEYVSRILAVDSIADNLTEINNAYIDQNSLKAKIDKSLIQLISRYNEDEEPLRKEEKYWNAVKNFEGDKEAAKLSIVKAEQKRQQQTLNLVEQMSNVILTEEDTSPSERKTAVSFLSGYIRKGFQSYITEKKEAFPSQITMNVDGWTGASEDGSNAEELCRAFENEMTNRRAAEIEKTSRNNEKAMQIGAIVLAVLGVLGLFTVTALGVLLLAGAAILAYFSFKTKKTTAEKIEAIEQDYANRIVKGKAKINQTTSQWKEAKNVVYQFESNPIREIIA